MPKLEPWVEELEANEGKARRDRLSLLRIYGACLTTCRQASTDIIQWVAGALPTPVHAQKNKAILSGWIRT